MMSVTMGGSMSNKRASSRAMTLAAAVILASGIAQAARGESKVTPRPSGQELLARVVAAEDKVPYEARQTTIVSDGDRAEATITDEVNFGLGRGRVLFVMPSSANGRTIIRNGKTRWTIEPSSRTVIQSDAARSSIKPALASDVVRKILQAYRIVLSQSDTEVSGRPSYVLEIIPRRSDRPRRSWCIDKSTYLVLKRDVYDTRGRLEQTSIYSNIRYNPKFDSSLLAFRAPSGFHVVRRNTDSAVATLDAARRLLPLSREVPASLGAGFDFTSARVVDSKGVKSVLVEYSDGLVGLSLFKMPASSPMPTTDERPRTVSIGSTRGILLQPVPAFRVLSWQSAGSTFSLVSDVAEETMIRLARSIKF